MARVGVHIEAELSGADTDLNRYDRDELYNELDLLLKTYFDKLDGGVEAHTAKVKSLVIDYGKLGKGRGE